MLKNTRLYSIFFNKCPKCHEGDFFTHRNAYWPVREFDKMNPRCTHCGENLMPEPGFYWGAMYLSYGLYVLIILAALPIGLRWFHLDITELVVYLVLLFILLTPLFFRIARRIWLTLFVSFDKSKMKGVKTSQALVTDTH